MSETKRTLPHGSNSRPASATVRRVLRGELCSGCGLCAGISEGAMVMESQSPGYNRPVGRRPALAPGVEAKIAQACPGAIVAPWSDAKADPYWGPWRRVLVGAATDPTIQFEGSSGGAISGILVHALGSGLVEGVLHVAADPDHPTRNVATLSRTTDEVIRGAGSRYTASSPLSQIDTVLSEGRRIAFVGKPCDVSALRQLGRADARIQTLVPLMVSFFCGGIPSHNGVRRILDKMGVGGAPLAAFRYRGRGWPGMCVAETASAKRVEMTYAESWGDHLSKEVQFRCKICPDAVGGVADVACADAWYGDDDGYPTFDEEVGRSLIIARTATGERIVEAAVRAGAIAVQPIELREIDRMQPAQARRKRLVLARTAALRFLFQPRPRMGGLEIAAAARKARLGEQVRNFVGTLRRTLSGRRSTL